MVRQVPSGHLSWLQHPCLVLALLAKTQWDGGDTILPPTPKQERTTLLLPLDGGKKKKRKIHPKKKNKHDQVLSFCGTETFSISRGRNSLRVFFSQIFNIYKFIYVHTHKYMPKHLQNYTLTGLIRGSQTSCLRLPAYLLVAGGER